MLIIIRDIIIIYFNEVGVILKDPIIGIVGRPAMDEEDFTLMKIKEDYRNAVLEVGGIPLMILPTQIIEYEKVRPRDMPLMTEEEKNKLVEVLNKCDGFISPGGTKWYEYDRFICDYAIKQDKPFLGICLGMQLLSSYNKDYNLALNEDKGINHYQPKIKYAHKIKIIEGTKLKDIVGSIEEIEVNSRHNYHIIKPNDFISSAYSEDGIIEAIELPNKKFIMGIQWHVEVMFKYDDINKKILNAFIDKSRDN